MKHTHILMLTTLAVIACRPAALLAAQGSQPGEEEKRACLQEWQEYAHFGRTPALAAWLSWAGEQKPPQRGRPDRSLAAFHLLGGRAAIEETLQLQVLEVAENRASAPTIQVQTDAGIVTMPSPEHEQNVALNTLKGVQVKAHPYDMMLTGKTGGRLPLAERVPPDRLFVHISRPQTIETLLNEGAAFAARMGTGVTGNSLRYDLKHHYLARLGMNETWVKAVLKAGLVSEFAIFSPDLFFIDGTDVTVVARIVKPNVLAGLLALVGCEATSEGQIMKRTARNGLNSYWTLLDDLLVVGTNPNEVRTVHRLHTTRGSGSLGRTAEFRYMLTQMPRLEDTRVFGYLSDPFIRRLVSPAVKIGQRRRVLARAEMEYAMGGALLARMYGATAPLSIGDLCQGNYLPSRFSASDYRLLDDLRVQSPVYGALPHLRSLLNVGIDKVSAAEAKAYQRYVDNYTRYWRQFFDPIAIRLGARSDGSMATDIFILPLIDNTAYDQLREVLLRKEDGVALQVPRLEPAPITMLSIGLRKEILAKARDGVAEMAEDMSAPNLSWPAGVGPGLHLAVHDSAPVVALGSGDILGAFGGNMGEAFGEGSEVLFFSAIASILTRPCTLLIEADNPAAVQSFLLQVVRSALAEMPSEVGGRLELYQLTGRDTWVVSFSLADVATLRFAISTQGRYVLINNVPSMHQPRVTGMEDKGLCSARLQARPSACQLQLPALHANTMESMRRVSMQSLAALLPIVASGTATLEQAPAVHARLFGTTPLHAGEGTWQMADGDMASSLFGSPRTPRQPPHSPGDRSFGALSEVDRFSVGMQFEDTGLRTSLKWMPARSDSALAEGSESKRE